MCSQNKNRNTKINWGALGMGASLACAIHCAVLPLVLTSLPLFGINIINNSAFEYCMIVLAIVIGSYALWHGCKKHHRRIAPFFLFTAGSCCWPSSSGINMSYLSFP